MCYDRRRAEACVDEYSVFSIMSVCVCVYYCRTYYKAVRGGGRRRVDDMCYDRRWDRSNLLRSTPKIKYPP
jgi:hypothetical protein